MLAHSQESTPSCESTAALCVTQIAGVEPDNGSIQPSVTRLHRLARLRVAGSLGGNVCEVPPGFGGLSGLTSLRFSMVGDKTVQQSQLAARRNCWTSWLQPSNAELLLYITAKHTDMVMRRPSLWLHRCTSALRGSRGGWRR